MKYLLVLVFFVSCSVVDVSQETPLSGMSVGEAWAWIDENITFKSDFIDDFQLPSTTYALRTGDCEDFAILLMSAMHARGGELPELVCIDVDGLWHYIVEWRGTYYEAQIFGKFYDAIFVESRTLWEFSYQQSIDMSH
jgi:hypothetical protein